MFSSFNFSMFTEEHRTNINNEDRKDFYLKISDRSYLLDWRQRGPIRSVLLVIIGCLVTQFSRKRL